MALLLSAKDRAAISAEAVRRGLRLRDAMASSAGANASDTVATPRHLAVLADWAEIEPPRRDGLLREAMRAHPVDPVLDGFCVEVGRRHGLTLSVTGGTATVRRRLRPLLDVPPSELAAATRAWLAELRDQGVSRRIVSAGELAYVFDELARLWLRHGDIRRARWLSLRAAKADPSWLRPRITRAQIEAESGLWSRALDALGPELRATPTGGALGLAVRMFALAGGHSEMTDLVKRVRVMAAEADPRVLWDAAQASLCFGSPAEDLVDRLADRALNGGGPRLLDHLSQTAAGGHRWLNDKVSLQRLLRRYRLSWAQAETYLLPEERLAAARRLREPAGRGGRWIRKPASLFGGKGVTLLRPGDALPDTLDPAVLQRYVEPPWLADGHKAHLRVYWLVLPSPRRRVWMSLDGPARLSPVPWAAASEAADPAVHITNTNLHWTHPDLRIDAEPEGTLGHVRRVSDLLGSMRRDRPEAAHPEAALVGFCRGLAIGLLPEMAQPLAGLLALDLLFDEDGRVWLLEIETRPQIEQRGVPVVAALHTDLARQAWPLLQAYLCGMEPPDRSGAWKALV